MNVQKARKTKTGGVNPDIEVAGDWDLMAYAHSAERGIFEDLDNKQADIERKKSLFIAKIHGRANDANELFNKVFDTTEGLTDVQLEAHKGWQGFYDLDDETRGKKLDDLDSLAQSMGR